MSSPIETYFPKQGEVLPVLQRRLAKIDSKIAELSLKALEKPLPKSSQELLERLENHSMLLTFVIEGSQEKEEAPISSI